MSRYDWLSLLFYLKKKVRQLLIGASNVPTLCQIVRLPIMTLRHLYPNFSPHFVGPSLVDCRRMCGRSHDEVNFFHFFPSFRMFQTRARARERKSCATSKNAWISVESDRASMRRLRLRHPSPNSASLLWA